MSVTYLNGTNSTGLWLTKISPLRKSHDTWAKAYENASLSNLKRLSGEAILKRKQSFSFTLSEEVRRWFGAKKQPPMVKFLSISKGIEFIKKIESTRHFSAQKGSLRQAISWEDTLLGHVEQPSLLDPLLEDQQDKP